MKKTKIKKEFNERKIIGIIFVVVFMVQIIMLNNIYFQSGWDVSQINYTAEKYAKTGIFDNQVYYMKYPYFDVYPNNIFLASIFGIIIKIAMFFNIAQPNKVLVLLSIILVDLAGIILVKTIGNITNKKITKVLGASLYAVFIGISPWFLIPYSDTFSILFPISILYNYTKKEKKLYNYLLIGTLSYLGYLIKPTNIIILIAIVIIEIYKTFFRNKVEIKQLLKNSIIILLGVLIVVILKFGLQNIVKYEVNDKYSLSLYHYLMMGVNQETSGSFSNEDLMNSLKAENYNTRTEYNKKIYLERVNSLSFKEFCEFGTKKLLLNYNDGTLTWGQEGDFYRTKNKNDSTLAVMLKAIFYNKGEAYCVFSSIMQIIWIFIIISIMLGAILKEFDYKNSVIYLTIIGITLFTLIFEARARYLYLYTPYYIILAVTGIEVLYDKLEVLKKNNTISKNSIISKEVL